MLKKINWRYALGEIAIVILGITIAFSLNKWAENTRDRTAKQEYLQSLLVDLTSEQEHLRANIEAFQRKLNHIHQTFPYLTGRQKEGRDTIAQKIFGLAQIVYFHPNDITYKTLINTGDLGLFKDIDFKKELETYYSNHRIIQLDYERQNKINENYLGDFMVHQINYFELRQGNYDFIDQPLLHNIIQSLYGTYNIAIKTSEEGISRCEVLMSRIRQELK